MRFYFGRIITLKYDEYDAEGKITVLEVEENKKIVFSWGAKHNEETVVTITLNELDNKSTIIEVNESGLREEDPKVENKMMGQKEGWVYMLSCLKCYLENDGKDLRAALIH